MITFGFGLVHGFGFSFALRETLQFAGSHLLASLVSFNIGVEIGQIFVLAMMVPALALLFRLCRGRTAGHDHPVGARAQRPGTGWSNATNSCRSSRFDWPVLRRRV